jgi:hypothetical protein
LAGTPFPFTDSLKPGTRQMVNFVGTLAQAEISHPKNGYLAPTAARKFCGLGLIH